MANEKRLIYAKPLMQNGWHLVRTGESNSFLGSMSLADVPTVDAVEVVRCKDCKHRCTLSCGKSFCKEHFPMGAKDDDFCSYGERREGE